MTFAAAAPLRELDLGLARTVVRHSYPYRRHPCYHHPPGLQVVLQPKRAVAEAQRSECLRA